MTLTSPSGLRMRSYLPPYYENSLVIKDILEAQGQEIDEILLSLNNTLEQLFINTASWGLEKWEQELSLPQKDNSSLSERRERIISKLRGTGTATQKVVKDTAESYNKGTIEVIESPANYLLIIKFVNTMGIPTDLDVMKKSLRSVVPAHLDILFKYRYLIWKELNNLQLTWRQIAELNLTWSEWKVYICMQWDEMDLLSLTWDQLDSLTVSWNEWEVYV